MVRQKTRNAARIIGQSDAVRYGVLMAILVVFTLMLIPNPGLLRHPYQVGDVAKRNIKAPRDFIIEDMDATEKNRVSAADSIRTVYDLDASLAGKLSSGVRKSFYEMRTVLALARASETGDKTPADSTPRLKDGRTQLETFVGTPLSDEQFETLAKEGFSSQTADLVASILQIILNTGVVANKDILIKELDKGVTLRTIGSDTERVVDNLRAFYGPDQARTMVRIVGEPLLSGTPTQKLETVVFITRNLIRPNITLNRNETENRIRSAVGAVKPVLYQIKSGEMLLREGERITPIQLLKLRDLEAQTKNQDFFRQILGSAVTILCLIVIGYFLSLRKPLSQSHDPNRNMLFLAIVLVTFLGIARGTEVMLTQLGVGDGSIPATALYLGTPLAAAAMTVCLFFGLQQALPFVLVFGPVATLCMDQSLSLMLFHILSGAMGAYWVRDCRERKVFVKAGWKLGLLQIPLAFGVALQWESLQAVQMGWALFFAFTGGMIAGILTSGIAPLLEMVFDYTTDIKLLELANPDQPLLRRLMLEAPGTYNHSMIVGTLAEAAATEIGAHSLLARVGGYYHDIGKLAKPLYFIENQAGGKNRHDKLAPSMSALILITHVKDGVAMAKQHKLGESLIDIIRQHHGTSLIQFFFEKAKSQKGEEETVNPDDYRYPGSRPQSREAAIVMMADVVEAASRSLDNPTPSRIQGLIQKMINKIFTDSQLDECNITLKDLHKIAKSFNQILNGIYHHRIEYQESAAPGGGKRKNGHPDRQPTEPAPGPGAPAHEEGDAHLRRLGMS